MAIAMTTAYMGGYKCRTLQWWSEQNTENLPTVTRKSLTTCHRITTKASMLPKLSPLPCITVDSMVLVVLGVASSLKCLVLYLGVEERSAASFPGSSQTHRNGMEWKKIATADC